ncbi:MAG: FecR domain-containing protein [Mariniphaga sp.]
MANSNLSSHSFEYHVNIRSSHTLEDEIAEAQKAISEIKDVDSRKAFSTVQEKIKKNNKIKRLITVVSRIAAILFIPLLIGSLFTIYQLNQNNPQQFAIQEITSPSGIRSQILLPDGSKVWLNAESTVKFKIPFDRERREISLTGEAFFDVQKNPEVPFFVKSGNVEVSVLGTRFNFKAYDHENTIDVVLEEGKVNFQTDNDKTVQELMMKPGERAEYDRTTGTTKITSVKIDKYTAWHSGRLVFDDTPLPEVAAQLDRWYGIEVVLKDSEIQNYKITTTFENESLNQVLDLLELSSPIDINYENAKIDKVSRKQIRSKIRITKKQK